MQWKEETFYSLKCQIKIYSTADGFLPTSKRFPTNRFRIESKWRNQKQGHRFKKFISWAQDLHWRSQPLKLFPNAAHRLFWLIENSPSLYKFKDHTQISPEPNMEKHISVTVDQISGGKDWWVDWELITTAAHYVIQPRNLWIALEMPARPCAPPLIRSKNAAVERTFDVVGRRHRR